MLVAIFKSAQPSPGDFCLKKTQWAKINSRNIDLFVAKIFFFPEKVSRENLIPLRYALFR